MIMFGLIYVNHFRKCDVNSHSHMFHMAFCTIWSICAAKESVLHVEFSVIMKFPYYI